MLKCGSRCLNVEERSFLVMVLCTMSLNKLFFYNIMAFLFSDIISCTYKIAFFLKIHLQTVFSLWAFQVFSRSVLIGYWNEWYVLMYLFTSFRIEDVIFFCWSCFQIVEAFRSAIQRDCSWSWPVRNIGSYTCSTNQGINRSRR